MKIEQILDRLKEEDKTTYEHSIRCGNYLAEFAEEHGFGRVAVQEYREAGYLHDAGKLHVMKYIRSDVNIRELSEEERKDYREALSQHVKYSHPILKSIPDCKQVYLDAADYHHAHYNDPKAGYSIETVRKESDVTPCRTAIPEVAQMLAIVDVYDALTDPNRPYRNGAMPDEKVKEIMEDGVKEGQFNPALYEEFTQKVVPKLKHMSNDEKLGIKLPSEQKKRMMNAFAEAKPVNNTVLSFAEAGHSSKMSKLDKSQRM